MDAITDKHRLDTLTMQVKSIWKLNQSNGYAFDWTITQFVNLKMNVEYMKRSDKLNWVFTITKKRGSCIITINTGNYEGDIDCCVRYGRGRFSTPLPAWRDSEGKHQVVFINSIINEPENQFLKSNILLLSFLFNTSDTFSLTFQPRASNDTCSFDYLAMHAKRTLKQIRDIHSSYFALHGMENIFEVHKAILVARSSYFRQYIQENCMNGETGEMKLNIKWNIMYCLISFLYAGQAVFMCREELKEFGELLEQLGISRIQTLKKLSIQ